MIHRIMWTWFHKSFNGKNKVVQNTLVSSFRSLIVARNDFESVKDDAVSRGFSLHSDNGSSVTYLTGCGDYVNVRLVSRGA